MIALCNLHFHRQFGDTKLVVLAVQVIDSYVEGELTKS